MHRSLPRSGQHFRTLLVVDLVAGALAVRAWRWTEQNRPGLVRDPSSRLWVGAGIAVAAILVAALLLRWAIYRSSSWEPSLLVALCAVVTTPLVGAPLIRSVAGTEVGERTAAATGMQLRHQTAASRMGRTKRLSEL